MKRLLTLIAAMVPGTAMAHGLHAPVPVEAHGVAHGAPVVAALVVIALAIGLALAQRGRS